MFCYSDVHYLYIIEYARLCFVVFVKLIFLSSQVPDDEITLCASQHMGLPCGANRIPPTKYCYARESSAFLVHVTPSGL